MRTVSDPTGTCFLEYKELYARTQHQFWLYSHPLLEIALYESIVKMTQKEVNMTADIQHVELVWAPIFQSCRFSWNIAKFTPETICFHYQKIHLKDQSIPKKMKKKLHCNRQQVGRTDAIDTTGESLEGKKGSAKTNVDVSEDT